MLHFSLPATLPQKGNLEVRTGSSFDAVRESGSLIWVIDVCRDQYLLGHLFSAHPIQMS